MCLFSNVYMHCPLFIKKQLLRNSLRENILCIYLSQRKRKRQRLVRRARTLCASFLCYRLFYFGRQTLVNLKEPQIVWEANSALRRLCQKTRIDLYYSFYMHLVCEFLIIYIFLFIVIYSQKKKKKIEGIRVK